MLRDALSTLVPHFKRYNDKAVGFGGLGFRYRRVGRVVRAWGFGFEYCRVGRMWTLSWRRWIIADAIYDAESDTVTVSVWR